VSGPIAGGRILPGDEERLNAALATCGSREDVERLADLLNASIGRRTAEDLVHDKAVDEALSTGAYVDVPANDDEDVPS
jgi:hypothetical protein